MRSSKGVTIIGLAITVVILGTLALVALNSGLGEGSMLQKTASGAKDWSEKEIIDEVNVLLADYAVDAVLSEDDTINSYLLELQGANLIQDYRYIGKYLVMYKDVYCELEKDGFENRKRALSMFSLLPPIIRYKTLIFCISQCNISLHFR